MTNLRSVRLLTSYTIAISILTAFIWFFLPSFNITQLTDKLTIIQMLLNMVLLIPSLLLLITQIWENNTAPRLDLEMKIYREDSRQSDSLFIPTQGEEVQTLQISLMNDGNAVALWYIIRIFIPKDLIHSAQDVDLGNRFSLIIPLLAPATRALPHQEAVQHVRNQQLGWTSISDSLTTNCWPYSS